MLRREPVSWIFSQMIRSGSGCFEVDDAFGWFWAMAGAVATSTATQTDRARIVFNCIDKLPGASGCDFCSYIRAEARGLGVHSDLFARRRFGEEALEDHAGHGFGRLDAFGLLPGEGKRAHPRPSRARIDDMHPRAAAVRGFVGISAKQGLERGFGRTVRAP